MIKRTGAFAAWMVVAAGLSFGQAEGPLTLDQAIRLSLDHSTSVKETQSAYLAAKARAGQDAARRRPQLGFDALVTRYDSRTTVSLPGMTTPFEVEPNNFESLSLALSQDLDISGQLGLVFAQAKLNARSAGYQAEATTHDQALTTTLTYYAVLRAEQNVRVAEASLAAYREQQATTTRLYTGGVGQRIDVYRADSQVAEAESERVRRLNELDAARSQLNDLIGRPLDTAVQLADPNPQDTNPATDGRTHQSLIDEAISHRPEALEAAVEVQAARKGIQVARTTSAPSMLVSLTGSRYPTTSFIEPRQNVAALTLNLSVPIYDGGIQREKVQEAKDDVMASVARQDRVRRDIALQVQNAALDIETARRRERAAEVDLEAAVAARRLAQQRFEAQVGLYIEVTDAQSALTAAEAAKVQATYDLLTAKAQLAHAMGTAEEAAK